MKIYVEQLTNVDHKAATFLGLDIEKGWYKVTNDCYGKVLIEGLGPEDPRSALYSGEEDVILETDDDLVAKYSFSDLSEIRKFTDDLFNLMERVNDSNN